MKWIFIIIFLSSKIYSYNLSNEFINGIYWKTFPINLQAIGANLQETDQLDQVINDAIQEWDNSVANNLWNYTPAVEPNNASLNLNGNYVRWSYDFGNETGYDPNKTLAITIRYSSGTFFDHAVIILNGNLPYLKSNLNNVLGVTVLHEMGHMLGIDHSNIARAIMAPSISNIQALTTDDINGANDLINQTESRQRTGFVAPMFNNNQQKVAACGTVEYIKSGNNKNPPGQFMLSIILGWGIVSLISKWGKKHTNLGLKTFKSR